MKSSGILVEEDCRREIGLMVQELVKVGQRPSNSEAAASSAVAAWHWVVYGDDQP